jgi:hypothetical protein
LASLPPAVTSSPRCKLTVLNRVVLLYAVPLLLFEGVV